MRRFLLVIEDCIDKVDVGSCFEVFMLNHFPALMKQRGVTPLL